MTPAPRLSGLHHVGVHSADPSSVLDFYRTIFDLRPLPLPAGQGEGCAYVEFGDGSALEVIPASIAGTEHVGFAVASREDLVILRDRLLVAGHRTGELRDLSALCCVDFYDPEGRRGQLVWPRAAQPSVRP
jgi:catechol 2,3-dioxygenase-like lactoylglutathione lyase family enzyme